jgi:outer membrane receptor for Fe3+-dicitrate
VFAQRTGKIAGKITDSDTNEPIAGANIILVDTRMGASSDLEGEFFIINIPPGTYNIEVQMIGYGTVRKEGIRISVNRTAFTDIELNPSLLESEVIVVTAEKAAIKKDQTSSIRNISKEEIEALPVESIDQIVQLQPGVVGSHFRGGRSNESSYMIDGVLVTESFLHEATMVEVTPQVVEDMEIITGTFNAEYGNAMSGVVNIVTKEGSDQLEGAASINVGNYLTSNKDKFIGLKDSDIRIQDYTFSLTGPIIKNNLSFILDSRLLTNKGYLNGIHRFNVDDYSDFRQYPDNYISEANGDGSYVDLDNSEELFLLGKLVYRPLNFFKTSLTYTVNDGEYQNYSNTMRFNPFGVGTSHSKSNMLSFHINHTLSQSAFYSLVASYTNYENGYYLYKDPLDSRYVHDFYGFSSGPGFSTGGQDKNHSSRKEEKLGLKFDLTWQLNKRHSFKTGIDLIKIKLNQRYSNIRNLYEGTDQEAVFTIDPITNKRNYLYYEPEVRSARTIYTDHYVKEPVQFAAYIQDKMEFDAMVVNLGLRYDFFDPNKLFWQI